MARADFQFSTIGALNQISEQKFVIIVGTIKSFASEDSWFYNACRNCNRKVTTKTISKKSKMVPMVLRMLWFWSVRTMAVTVRLFTPIRVPIRVQDCTGIVTLTLFEREVLKLLKVNASQLLDKNLDLANEGNFPPELNALLNRKFAFKIAIGSFNIQNKSDGYSVSKLTDNPTVISELEAEIISGGNIGTRTYIPRISLIPSNKKIPFEFQKRQFPLAVCFAMTINKSQGQSLSRVGLYLKQPVFTHGQLYVALSRVKTRQGIKLLILDNDGKPTNKTTNVVYKEVFRDL
ncbi:putative DNA helicase [Helianthus annuus]|nr:putative DNA helicase [Helianthus annuus]KAJ0607189.1 putative DNA helicase [Helianthus annuus]KAJ0767248.1 putative DNA helicase [Helianthus annuus]KAJ0773095.1 putative DNA helicase [Helianthus annuus]